MVMTRGSGSGTSDLERSGLDDEEIGEFIVIEVSTMIRESIPEVCGYQEHFD